MKEITLSEILLLSSRDRSNFINSLWGIRNASVIGSRSDNGIPNFAIFNSLNHIGANPPLASLIFRPDTVKRDTLDNILATKYYSLNNITESNYPKAHLTSAKLPKNENEAEYAGLLYLNEAEYNVPYLYESTVVTILKYEQHVKLKINGTILLIGSVQKILLKENLITEDHSVDHFKAGSMSVTGLDTYNLTKQSFKLPYVSLKGKD